jgi:hypothetical protein
MNHTLRAALFLASLGLLACTSTSPTSWTACAAPTRAEASDRVVPVHGVFAGDGSLEGHVDVFTSRAPVLYERAELYAKSFPTEEFDAQVVRVTAVGGSRYVADLRLARPDSRIQRETRFQGFIFNADSDGAVACADSAP